MPSGYVVRARLVDVVIIKSVSPIHARMVFPCRRVLWMGNATARSGWPEVLRT
jgi:hypothetical protein